MEAEEFKKIKKQLSFSNNEELGQALGVGGAHISRLLNGTKKITTEMANKIKDLKAYKSTSNIESATPVIKPATPAVNNKMIQYGKTLEHHKYKILSLLSFGFMIKDIAEMFNTSRSTLLNYIKILKAQDSTLKVLEPKERYKILKDINFFKKVKKRLKKMEG